MDIQSLKSHFAVAALTQKSKRFFITENKQFHELKNWFKIFTEILKEKRLQSRAETTQRKVIHIKRIILNLPPEIWR